MPDLVIPPGSREIPAFDLVLVTHATVRYVALLDCWWRLPDGSWACRLRLPGPRSRRGLPPLTYVVAYDADQIRPLTKFDLVQPE